MKLKPCPLCGGKARVVKPLNASGPPYNVTCGTEYGISKDECGLVLFGGKETRKEMIAKWNIRATEPTH